MRKLLPVFVWLLCFSSVFAQPGNQPPATDTLPERERASMVLRKLREEGVVIVRIKREQRSIDAYIKAGKTELAERIRLERLQRNLKIYRAFRDNFTFCKVQFIYADDTRRMLQGERVFLDAALNIDSTLSLFNPHFVFCEYGTGEPFSDFKNTPITISTNNNYRQQQIQDTAAKRHTTSPASTSGLVFYDSGLQQLQRPFPFLEGVYMDNFASAVRSVNRQLETAYYRLVTNRDLRNKLKEERKKSRPK